MTRIISARISWEEKIEMLKATQDANPTYHSMIQKYINRYKKLVDKQEDDEQRSIEASEKMEEEEDRKFKRDVRNARRRMDREMDQAWRKRAAQDQPKRYIDIRKLFG